MSQDLMLLGMPRNVAWISDAGRVRVAVRSAHSPTPSPVPEVQQIH